METRELLPIGTRVTHFEGGSGTHGKGTIVAYNGVQPDQYFKEKPLDAIELANQAGLLSAVVSGLYDGARCPYVVHFDPSAKYPEGYKDVYEPTSIKELPRPVKGDWVVATRDGPAFKTSFKKGDVGQLLAEQGIDSEYYYHVELDNGRQFGPSLEDYWEKHIKE